MHPALKNALDIILVERNAAKHTDAFGAVHALIVAFGELNLANRLFSEIPRTVPVDVVAELFDFLVWQTDDNGAAMMREVEKWLRDAKDTRKLLIALQLEVYPFVDAHEMYRVLSSLALTTPEVAKRCEELILMRKTGKPV